MFVLWCYRLFWGGGVLVCLVFWWKNCAWWPNRISFDRKEDLTALGRVLRRCVMPVARLCSSALRCVSGFMKCTHHECSIGTDVGLTGCFIGCWPGGCVCESDYFRGGLNHQANILYSRCPDCKGDVCVSVCICVFARAQITFLGAWYALEIRIRTSWLLWLL